MALDAMSPYGAFWVQQFGIFIVNISDEYQGSVCFALRPVKQEEMHNYWVG